MSDLAHAILGQRDSVPWRSSRSVSVPHLCAQSLHLRPVIRCGVAHTHDDLPQKLFGLAGLAPLTGLAGWNTPTVQQQSRSAKDQQVEIVGCSRDTQSAAVTDSRFLHRRCEVEDCHTRVKYPHSLSHLLRSLLRVPEYDAVRHNERSE
jgi:hypothetical protein